VRVGAGVGVRGGESVGNGVGVRGGVGVARGVGVAVRVGVGETVGVGVAVNDGSGRSVIDALGATVGLGEGDAPTAPPMGGTSERTAPKATIPPTASTSRIAMRSPTRCELPRRTGSLGGGPSIGSVGSLPRPLMPPMLARR